MKIKTRLTTLLYSVTLIACTAAWAADPVAAQPAPPPSAPPRYSAAELEKLAAPIALHPDPLIAILLPASVYPLEIVQAARFIRDTNNIPQVDDQSWDENVKALARFPELLQKMNDDLTWTMDLGQAFLDQQTELMDTIQALRAKANSAGVLQTTPQQIIVVTNTVIERTVEQQIVYVTNTIVQIQPANPQVIYIPTYPPSIYYYYPPPVYVGPPPALVFAAGITVGFIIANNCNWHSGGIYVGHHGAVVWRGGSYHGHGNVKINGNVNINTGNNVNINTGNKNINTGNINSGNRPTTYDGKASTTATTSQKWQPDQSRMASSGAAGSKPSTQTAQARGWSSGTAQAAPANRGTTTATRPSPSTGAASAQPRPTPSQSYNRPAPSTGTANAQSRPSPSQSYNQSSLSPSNSRPTPSASQQSAFSGVRNSAGTQQASSRGSASRGGGGGGRSSGGRGQ
jgi:hypothetical protein